MLLLAIISERFEVFLSLYNTDRVSVNESKNLPCFVLYLKCYIFSSFLKQVSEERVVVGSDSGKVLLFENGELKSEFAASASADSTADGGSIR